MLNIIKSKLKNISMKKSKNDYNITIRNKEFLPTIRDWKNSIYVYNKNILSLIPVANMLAMKLIKGYFNSYDLHIESKIRRKKKLRSKVRKLSSNKIFISDGEFKHTNDKINITLYIYNKQKLNYLLKLKKRYIKLFKKPKFLKKLKLINKVGLNIWKQQQKKSIVLINLFPNKKWIIYLIQNLYYKKFIKKSFLRLKYYMYYKYLLYINKVKFEKFYLQNLISLIKKIYKKNVEFNIINLKYYYLNSDILTESFLLKVRRKRAILKYLRDLNREIKINNIVLNERSKYFFDLENLFITNNKDIANNLMQEKKIKSNSLKKIVLHNINYKKLSGIKLEAVGRLNKRYTASRSQKNVKYIGNLENLYSSEKGYPFVLSRGNYKPNLQQTKLNSKSNIGSFGIKGWISGI